MKGLLIKDFRILLRQKTSLVIFMGLSIFMLINGMDVSFCLAYATILMTTLMIGTISYDEHENGMSFLLTLPVSRRQYAMSKYLFTIIGIIVTDVILLAVLGVYEAMAPGGIPMSEYVMTAALLFFIAIIMISIMIPVDFKYGVNKSRLVLLIFAGAGSVVMLVFSKFADAIPYELRRAVEQAALASPAVIGLILGIASLVILIISIICSIQVIKKKDY